MDRYCSLDGKCYECCEELVKEKDSEYYCPKCSKKHRLVNINRVRDTYKQKIYKYSLDNNKRNKWKMEEFENVYRACPEDSKRGKKKRDEIIAACTKESIGRNNDIWSFSSNLNIKNGVALKGGKRGNTKRVLKINVQNGESVAWNSLKVAAQELKESISTLTYRTKQKTILNDKGERYFFIFEDEACPETIGKIMEDEKRKNSQFVLLDINGVVCKNWATKRDVAKFFDVTDTTISQWLDNDGKIPEHRGYKGCTLKKKDEEIHVECEVPDIVSCKMMEEFNNLKGKYEEEKRRNEKLERQLVNDQSKIVSLEDENSYLKTTLRLRKEPNYDMRIPFMCPIAQFLDEKMYLLAGGRCVYILRDEEGKAYVGQSALNDYSRIKDHFKRESGTECTDQVTQAYNNGMKFFIERIITEWGDGTPFNLDDVETHFIKYYNSFENGYNQTRGNHRELNDKFDVYLSQE